MIVKTFWICNCCGYQMSGHHQSYKHKCGGEFIKQEWVCVDSLKKAFAEISPYHYCAEILILKDKLGIPHTEFENEKDKLFGEATTEKKVK